MLEAGTMLLFCAVLFASVALGWSIIPALFVGVLLFMGYGLVRRCSLRAMASRAAGSVRSAGTVVVAFVLIGVLTSLWRASGTIAFIVAHSTAVIHAATVIPLSFLLCSAMSVLVGSSFASAATMGTICMSLGLSMQANPVMLGGAILAGAMWAIVVRRFPPVPCWSNSLRIRTCSILLPACCARVRCRLC